MSKFDIGIAIYLALGLLGYIAISGVGTGFNRKQKLSRVNKLLVILLWPLAMIGAIKA
jgi:hypothetical protein